ncbi:MAG: hypothetical protein ACTTID_03605 [Bacillales bacterium]
MEIKLKLLASSFIIFGLTSCVSKQNVPDNSISLKSNNYYIIDRVTEQEKECMYPFYALHMLVNIDIAQDNAFGFKNINVPVSVTNFLVTMYQDEFITSKKNIDYLYNSLNIHNFYYDYNYEINDEDFTKLFHSSKIYNKVLHYGFYRKGDYKFQLKEGSHGFYCSYLVANKIAKYTIFYNEFNSNGTFIQIGVTECYILKDVSINVLTAEQSNAHYNFPDF